MKNYQNGFESDEEFLQWVKDNCERSFAENPTFAIKISAEKAKDDFIFSCEIITTGGVIVIPIRFTQKAYIVPYARNFLNGKLFSWTYVMPPMLLLSDIEFNILTTKLDEDGKFVHFLGGFKTLEELIAAKLKHCHKSLLNI
jgi:hypothetical protein